MTKRLLKLKTLFIYIVLVFAAQNAKAQFTACANCPGVPTFTLNFSNVYDTVATVSNVTRNNNCCSDANCIRFIVYLNPATDLLNFDVVNPSPSGSAFYSINCSTLTSIGTPVCVYGQTLVCITYCKPGGDQPDYKITQTRVVKASPNKTVRVGCSAQMTVTGLSAPTITWTSVFPGVQGQYNSFLSCTSGCSLTNVTPTAVVLPYIDYKVSGTPNTVCGGTSSDTVRVYIVPGLTTQVTPTNANVCSSSSGSITLTATVSGGAPPYTYTWSTSANTQTVSVGPGSYTVLIKDTANSCPAIVNTVVVGSVTTPSAPTVGSNSPLCVGQTLSLTATNSGGTTWDWTGPNSFTSTAQNPTVANSTTVMSGNYSVTMTFSGCTGPPGIVNVTVNPIPAAPSPSNNSAICVGQNLNLSANTISGATYSWTGPNGFSSNLQNPTIIGASTAASGVYTVYVTVNGCSGPFGTTTATVNPIPAAPTPSNNSIICAGQTLSLSANTIAGATYSWTGPNSFSSSLQNPTIAGASTLASGVYSVNVTVLGCTGSFSTTTATVNPIPAAPSPSNNSIVCAGQNLSLTVNTVAGATYSWTGPNAFTSNVQNPTIVGAGTVASGVYSVNVTVGGCTGSFSTTTATVNPIPAAPSPSNNSIVCAGQNLSLTVNTVAGATYSWTGPNGFNSTLQNPTIVGAGTVAAGIYSVNVTVGGCTGSFSTTTATVNPIPGAPTPSNNSIICAGQTLSLSANTIAGATYSWTGPNGFNSTLQNPTIVGAGTVATGIYSVNVTVGGCTGSFSTTTATVNPIPAAPSPSNNSIVCAGQNLNLIVNTVAGATYSWTGPNGFTSNIQNPTIVGAGTVASGVYSVNVTVGGCTGSFSTTTATVNPIPAAPSPSNNSIVCAGQTLSLSANTIAGATYSWTGPNAFTSNIQNPTIVGASTLASGVYSLNVTVGGCTSSFSTTTATVNPIPAAPSPSNNSIVCAGSTLSLTANTIAGATYSWTGPNGFASTLQNPSIVGASTLASGVYSVNVTVGGCTGSFSTTTATVNPIPGPPTPTNNSPICVGQNLNFTVNTVAGATYSWTGPNGFNSTLQNPTIVSASTLATGAYSVNVTVGGCTSTYGITNATVNPLPGTPTPSNNSIVCAGSTLSLTANTIASATYSWTGPNGFTSTLQNPTIVGASTLASGVYSVFVTVLGCTGSFSTTTATVNPIPAVPNPSNNSIICAGQTLSLTANTISGATYSWTGPNSFSSSLQNPTIANATTVTAGDYTLFVTVGGCSSPIGITGVTINPIPLAPNASNNSTICSGQTLNLFASTITAATYSWTGPNAFSSSLQNPTIAGASTLASGVYSVYVTVGGCNGPIGTTTVTINQTPGVPTPSNNSLLCEGQTLSLTTNPLAGATYSWMGPNSFTSSAQNPTIANTTTLAAGVYSVFVTVNGCSGPIGTTTVTINPTPPAPNAGNNSTICAGQTLLLTASTNTAATGYNWIGPNSFTSNLQNPSITNASTLAAGVYSVYVTVGGCDSPIGTTTVSITPLPVAPATSNNSPLCTNQTLQLNAALISGATYSWTGPNSFSSNLQNPTIPNAQPIHAGVYTVYVTVNGCDGPIAVTTVSVNNMPPAPTLTNNSPVCETYTVLLSAANFTNAVFNWSGPNSFTSTIQNPSITPASTLNVGTYSCYITVGGCPGPMSTTDVSITPTPTAPSAANNSSMCAGSTLSLTAGNIPGATYYWVGPNSFTSNVQNPVLTNVSIFEGGTYSVYATVNGCQGPAGLTTVTINAIPGPPTGLSNSPVCNGQDLTFTINPPGGIYSWTGPNSFTSSLQNPTISPATMAANGNYSVTVTLFGCTSPPAVIGASVGSVPSAPQPTATTPLCVGATLSLSTTFSSNVTFYWLGPNSFTAAAQNPTLANVTLPASGVYTVYGSINGCDGPASTVTVVVDPPAFVDAGPILDTICASAGTIALTGTVSGGGSTGGLWNSSGTGTFLPTNSLVTTYTMSLLDASSPSFQIVLTSVGGGCPTQSDVVTFMVLGSPTVDVATNLNVCKNEFVPLSGTITGVTNSGTWTANGGTGTYNPGFNFVNGNYYPSSADTSLGSLWFVLTSVNNKGCSPGKDSVRIQFITAPIANFINTRACTNQTISFTDMSAPSPSIASYFWDFGDTTGTSNLANPVYTYSVIDTFWVNHVVVLSNGCRDTVNKQLIIYNSAIANFSNTSVCVGYNTLFTDLSTITPDTLVSWNWTFGDGGTSTLTDPQHLFANTGSYAVNFTVTTSKGCPTAITRTIAVNPNPNADFIKSADYVLAYDNVQFTDQSAPNPVGTWSWTFGGNGGSSQQNPNVTFPDKGIYPIKLVVTDNNGCTDTIVKDIYVTLLPMVPTAFTPNNDGTNDILYVKGGPFRSMSFRVYNNWGELLFTSDDQDKGWDGTYKGQPAPLGVYVWILDVELYNGTQVRKTGDVTILK